MMFTRYIKRQLLPPFHANSSVDNLRRAAITGVSWAKCFEEFQQLVRAAPHPVAVNTD